MRCIIIIPLIILWLFSDSSRATNRLNITDLGNLKIREFAKAILDYYKQRNLKGIPIELKDPMDIAEIKANVPSVDTIFLRNSKLHGLSKVTVDFIKVNVAEMTAEISISLETLNLFGNYSISHFFSSSTGPFAIKTHKIQAEAKTKLEINEFGHLEAGEIWMDFTFKNIDIKFDNLSIIFGFMQNIFNTMPNLVMDSIKPYILSEFKTFVRQIINKESAKIPIVFPNSVIPIDQIITEIRRALRARACDPFQISDKNQTIGISEVKLSNSWITGLTSIYRVGNVMFELKENNLYGNLQIGTGKIKGNTQWELGFIGGFSVARGTATFSMEYLKVDISFKQSMDTRITPELETLSINSGNIQVRFDGAGTADYIIELLGNIFPNLLRNQITEALETPIKKRIQEQLNMINVEQIVLDTANRIEEESFQDIIDKSFSSSTCPLSKVYF